MADLFGDVFGNTITGGSSSDRIYGRGGDDILDGGAGDDQLFGEGDDDTLTGGAGTDTFVYDSRGFGRDTITDFNVNGEKIDLSFLKVADFDSLKPFITQVGQDAVITLGWGGNSERITLKNVLVGDLSDADFKFNTSITDLTVDGNATWSDFLFGGKGNDRISGFSGDDTLVGGVGNDTLIGGAGDDSLWGRTGNDTFVYDSRGFGRDVINDFNTNGDKIDLTFLKLADYDSLKPFAAQVGQDVVITLGWGGDSERITLKNTTLASLSDADFTFNTSTANLVVDGNNTWSDFLFGGKGNDRISGFSGDDTLVGGVGNDTLIGGSGDDSLWGRTGNDTFVYDSRGFGRDVINDFNTNGDKIDLTFLKLADYDSLKPFAAQVGQDVVITLGWGGDSERITLKNTTLAGLSDADFTFNTSTASLVVDGNNTWSDFLFGGKGNDRISGFSGDDTLVGGVGNDTLIGGSGDDSLWGRTGNDIFLYDSRGFGRDVINDFNTNGDKIDLTVLKVADFESLRPFAAQVGQDVVITLGWGGDSERITLKNTTLAGLSDADFKFNTSAANLVVEGNTTWSDFLFGGKGSDKIYGYSGDDTLVGGAGNDTLFGGTGADRFFGGAGTDTVSYVGTAAGVSVNLAGTGSGGEAQGDTFNSVENVDGTSFADTLIGNAADNRLQGFDGNDDLRGGDGADILVGGAGADKFDGGNGVDTVSYFSSSTGVRVNLQTGTAGDGEAQGDTLVRVENISGSQGHDKLYGNTGANTLQGWSGNDLLQGGAGKDTLSGGAGADKFVYVAAGDSVVGANADRITDFSRAQGDKIDLSGIDANTGTTGNQAFTFIGTQAFHHTAGELRYAFNGSDTTIAGDINGDGQSDFHIVLTGNIALLASDFVL